MLGEVELAGIVTEILDVRDYRTEATDRTEQTSTAKKLSEKITKADGVIIVSPEYNHGYPGELKMMLDLVYTQYAQKPAGFCGVSAGPFGGARAVEQLRQVAVELHMVPIREAVYFPAIRNLFDESGHITDSSYRERVKKFLYELAWYAKSLKAAREKGGKI